MARVRMTVAGTPVGEIRLVVVTPTGTRRHEPLPLLLANDGPAYSRQAGLVRFLDSLTAAGRMPPCRVALLLPDDRDARYSANADYATAVVDDVLRAVTASYRLSGRPLFVGASLGALSALQSEWLRPGTFSGLLLQSGSFFRRGLDDEESYEHWARITDFVSSVRRARKQRGDATVAMTCGADEENLANNRQLAQALARQGQTVDLTVVPGRHDWPQWRAAVRLALPILVGHTIEPATRREAPSTTGADATATDGPRFARIERIGPGALPHGRVPATEHEAGVAR
ncbi:MAG: alpha/beta hydrolase-fold protein [Terracoccus sp.]